LCKQILIELENSYTELLKALKLASSLSIPLKATNSKKFWWDVELSQLKADSCSTHAQWVTAGRPRSGPIFVAKTKAKAKYKNEIRKKKSSSINQISDNLSSALLGSSQQSFWKIWNSNFKTKTCKNNIFLADSDQTSVASRFVKHFADVCNKPYNNSDSDHENKLCMNRLLNYTGHSNLVKCTVDSDLVYNMILNMKDNKAVGLDNISAQHLKLSHPIVSVVLSKFFELFVFCNYVSVNFGQCFIVPISKDDSSRSLKKVDDFRGITISSIVSKVFENVLFTVYGSNYMTQFGFKKCLGCPHANLYC